MGQDRRRKEFVVGLQNSGGYLWGNNFAGSRPIVPDFVVRILGGDCDSLSVCDERWTDHATLKLVALASIC